MPRVLVFWCILMNLPATMYVLRWFLRDTFRQASASRLSWLMFGISGAFILVCLSMGVRGDIALQRDGESVDFLPANDPLAETARSSAKGVAVLDGELTVFFGFICVPLGRDAREAVHFLELLLAGVVADSLGILLALVWTGGFVPAFLEAQIVSVLLAKPIPRWTLLLGKYLGVLAFVAAQTTFFVAGTWFALAVRTGVWDFAYLLCVPMLLLHFAIFFAVSAFLAVRTRSTVVCVFGSLVFWFACGGVNYGRHAVLLSVDARGISPFVSAFANVVYWILPKPADLGMVLFDTLRAGNSFQRLETFQGIDRHGGFYPLLSLATCFVFTCFVLVAATRKFARTDY